MALDNSGAGNSCRAADARHFTRCSTARNRPLQIATLSTSEAAYETIAIQFHSTRSCGSRINMGEDSLLPYWRMQLCDRLVPLRK